MASRAKDWFAQGERDLAHARQACETAYYEWACFAAQQAAEKAVKAVFQHLGAEARGHSIKGLLKGLSEKHEIAEELMNCARLLDRFYIWTRYPNGFDDGIPADHYIKKDAEEAIRSAETILRFCHDCLSGQRSRD